MTDNPARISDLETLIAHSRKGFPQKSLYILELPIFNPENGFPFIEGFCASDKVSDVAKVPNEGDIKEGARAINCSGEEEFQRARALQNLRTTLIKAAQSLEPDILCLRFNIESTADIEKAVEILEETLPQIELPLMLRGSGDDEIDRKLLPELSDCAEAHGIECIISSANENTYKEIIPHTKGQHFVVLRSPIDINLAKEINILSSDLGQPLERIIIDTDIGGLGYGFEYGYSIIEKIRQEGANDKFLEMPVISFACEEALKTKEAKSDRFSRAWGDLKTRSIMFETAAASAIRAAGANLIVINHPETLKTMKGLK